MVRSGSSLCPITAPAAALSWRTKRTVTRIFAARTPRNALLSCESVFSGWRRAAPSMSRRSDGKPPSLWSTRRISDRMRVRLPRDFRAGRSRCSIQKQGSSTCSPTTWPRSRCGVVGRCAGSWGPGSSSLTSSRSRQRRSPPFRLPRPRRCSTSWPRPSPSPCGGCWWRCRSVTSVRRRLGLWPPISVRSRPFENHPWTSSPGSTGSARSLRNRSSSGSRSTGIRKSSAGGLRLGCEWPTIATRHLSRPWKG